MRTCFPSASSANAIASCDPIESPSGRACDVRRKDLRRRISSRICSTGAAGITPAADCSLFIVFGPVAHAIVDARGGGRLGRSFRVELLQQFLDAVVLLDGLVEGECQLRYSLEPE